jgi:glycosyltransferase involved in cell wall biosynthesis
MHVLIIPSWYPAYPGDIGGSFFREQALALHRNGCKVGVIYPQMRSLRQWQSILTGGYGLEIQSDEGMTTLRYHGMNWYPKVKWLRNKLWKKKCLELFNEYVKLNGKPQIIHAHSIFNAGVIAKKISDKNKIPFLLTEHSTSYARELISEIELNEAINVCNASSINLAVSNEFCKLLSEKIKPKNWIYLPNIVNNKFFEKKLNKHNQKGFGFINVAMVDSKKRQENILLAFNNEFKGEKFITLTIGGDGPELQILKNLAKTLNISNQVEFTGALSRDQVCEKMAASNAFVLSSRYETFGVVVIEALALGLPVIATRCGGPESIVRKEDGILVPVDDVESLGKAMREIYENLTKYDKMKIRESCRERFSEKAIAKKLIKIYEEVIEGKKSNGP